METYEFESVDNLLREVAGGLPYESAKNELEKIFDGKYQCGSCEQFFNELEENSCPHCGSGNFVEGCIDD